MEECIRSLNRWTAHDEAAATLGELAGTSVGDFVAAHGPPPPGPAAAAGPVSPGGGLSPPHSSSPGASSPAAAAEGDAADPASAGAAVAAEATTVTAAAVAAAAKEEAENPRDASRFKAGDRVVLAPNYRRFSDAASGPLTPGAMGAVIDAADSGSSRVRVRPEQGGREWWYDVKALR